MKIKVWIILMTGIFLTACSVKQQNRVETSAVQETAMGDISAEETSEMESSSTNAASKEERGYHKITAEEAKKMMEEGDVTIVDVRSQEEYESGHIKDAILIPVERIGEEAPDVLPDKEAILLVYCRSGRRSKQASDVLVESGYQYVYDFGGIMDWNYEIEASDEERQ